MKYALVLVNIKGLGVKTFSYLIPDEMRDIIQIGQAVMVPFGRQGLINAFVVGFSDYLPGDFKAKKINRGNRNNRISRALTFGLVKPYYRSWRRPD